MKKLVAIAMFCAFAARADDGDRIGLLESRYATIESSITSLTSKIEKSAHESRTFKQEASMLLKNLRLQIEDMNKDIATERKANADQIAALKKSLAELGERVESMDRRADGEPKPLIGSSGFEQIPPSLKSFDAAVGLYDKGEFKDAAIAFADNIANAKKDELFFKNLYYLGLSFEKIGKRPEACRALATAGESEHAELKRTAAAELAKLDCNK
jgi:TolA-binding protein